MTSSKVITCRAAVCWAIGEPLKIEEIEVEPPQASEVRIKLLCSSLCHTDIHYWKDEHPTLFPKVLGHEGVGVVESVGEGVTDLKEGDFVIPTYLGECHECQNCTSKKTNLCSKYMLPFSGLMLDNTSRMSCKGQKLYHVFTCATWAEYTVVNVNYLVKMDPRLQLEHASLLSCGVSTGIGAAWKEANMEKGSTVAVFGLGAVGLGVILGAKLMGASKIIGVDLNEWKHEKGEELGMTDFINPAKYKKSISEIITEMTGGTPTTASHPPPFLPSGKQLSTFLLLCETCTISTFVKTPPSLTHGKTVTIPFWSRRLLSVPVPSSYELASRLSMEPYFTKLLSTATIHVK